MKTLNIPLEDKEYIELEKRKGDLTWKEFILKTTKKVKTKEKK